MELSFPTHRFPKINREIPVGSPITNFVRVRIYSVIETISFLTKTIPTSELLL